MPQFQVRTSDEGWEDALVLPALDLDDAVTEACQFYWHECDGWEWLRDGTFLLVREVGTKTVHKMIVGLEFEPSFSSYEVDYGQEA